ncbi:DUF3429 domain-containing protein [Sphingomonas bacterium]|uniref:DUF3429 domain-containing protein n=1 Tax=Sphingomonas bacterium TaxID=1895847 RepID=UPI001575B1DD|nr:DUF3429 domain-containing protein [Sphingomonas bacterium]
MTDRAHDPRVPANSILFGFGPMLPLLAGGAGAWLAPDRWPVLAVRLTVLWGAVILVFVAGVRRGYGFGSPRASTPVEVATMLVYFLLALAALLFPRPPLSLGLLAIGYALVALLDRRAALAGNAPAHFARLRPPQMLVGIVGLVGAMVAAVAR